MSGEKGLRCAGDLRYHARLERRQIALIRSLRFTANGCI